MLYDQTLQFFLYYITKPRLYPTFIPINKRYISPPTTPFPRFRSLSRRILLLTTIEPKNLRQLLPRKIKIETHLALHLNFFLLSYTSTLSLFLPNRAVAFFNDHQPREIAIFPGRSFIPRTASVIDEQQRRCRREKERQTATHAIGFLYAASCMHACVIRALRQRCTSRTCMYSIGRGVREGAEENHLLRPAQRLQCLFCLARSRPVFLFQGVMSMRGERKRREEKVRTLGFFCGSF